VPLIDYADEPPRIACGEPCFARARVSLFTACAASLHVVRSTTFAEGESGRLGA
jgi:hypothetical protein